MTAETPSCPARGSRVRALSAISSPSLPSAAARAARLRRPAAAAAAASAIAFSFAATSGSLKLPLRVKFTMFCWLLCRGEVDGREPAAALQRADVVGDRRQAVALARELQVSRVSSRSCQPDVVGQRLRDLVQHVHRALLREPQLLDHEHLVLEDRLLLLELRRPAARSPAGRACASRRPRCACRGRAACSTAATRRRRTARARRPRAARAAGSSAARPAASPGPPRPSSWSWSPARGRRG